MAGASYDVSHLADAEAGETGVPHGAILVDFAEAVVRIEPEGIGRARGALVEAIGPEATVDAAAVVAAFHVVTRIADATGISLDQGMYERTAEMRAGMGLERLERPERSGVE